MYTGDNKEKFVDTSCFDRTCWRLGLGNSLSVSAPANLSPTEAAVWNTQEGFREGLLWIYAQNPKVLHCPADIRPTAAILGYDSYSGAGGLNGEEATALVKRLEEIFSTRRTAFSLWRSSTAAGIMRIHGGSTSWEMPVTTPLDPPGLIDSPADFHVDGSQMSWVDGHVSFQRWRLKDTIDFALSTSTTKFNHVDDAPYDTTAGNPDLLFVAKGFANASNP